MIKTHKILAGLIGVGLVLRIAAAFYMGDHVVELPGTADQLSYHTLALRVMHGNGFTFGQYWWPATAPGSPTARWSYLYTFFLVAIYTLFGPHPLAARLIQAILVGVLQPILTYLITRRMFEGQVKHAALISVAAAGINAVYTYFVYYSAALMTEPFFITLVLSSLYVALLCAEEIPGTLKKGKRSYHWLFLGGGLGLILCAAVLLRQLYLLFIPFLYLWIFWKKRSRSLAMLLVASAVIAAGILPFTVFNYARFNRFVLLNTNAGFVLFWANHPYYGTHFRPILSPETYNKMIPRDLLKLDEAALDQALMRLGIGFILENPGRYIQLSLSRIPVYFEFWPSRQDGLISNVARLAGFGLCLPFMGVGLVGSWIVLFRKIKPRILILSSSIFLFTLFITIYSALHIFAWALIRYRLPVDAVLISFAGFGLVELVVWVAGKWKIEIRDVP